MPCPDCGFEPSTVSPGDAVAALRSYPRRFRELVDPDDPDPTIDVERGRAAGEIEAIAPELEQVLVLDHPTLTSAPAGAADLDAAVEKVAALAERQPPEAWKRTGLRDGQTVTALDLLREAVHAGIHHLRIARGDFQG